MLTKLTSDDIAKLWNTVLKLAIRETIPPYVLLKNETLNNVLECLLTGDLHCWIAHEEVESIEDELLIYAIVFTTFFNDICSRTKSLMIYSIYATTLIPPHIWEDGIEKMIKFAKEKGCSMIIGHSANPIITKKAEELGGRTDYRYITIPLA